MKTILWFTGFTFYLAGTIFKALKMVLIKKTRGEAAAEEYAADAARKWAEFCVRTIGAEIEVTGKENLPEETFLLVGNHQGNLDIPVILSQLDRPIGFVAKKEMKKVPLLSYWMREIHCVFMDRDNPREAIKSINEAADFLKAGCSMVIYPEGTRSKSEALGEFKKGSLKLGIKAGVPIIPVTISGTYKAFEEKMRIRSTKVRLIIGKPIYPDQLSREEQNVLTDIIRDIIKDNLNKYK